MVEQAEAFREAGAGIQLAPNAMRVLEDLGVGGAVVAQASRPQAIEVRNRGGGKIVTMPLGRRFTRRHGLPYLTIHRADLQAALAYAAASNERIELLAGHRVVEFAIHGRGLTVMTESADGNREFRADILIGADGVHSFVRSVMPNHADSRPTGWSAWRAVVPANAMPERLESDRIGLWLGTAGHIVHYPVRGGAEFNLVVVAKSYPGPRREDAGARTAAHFAAWAKPARQLVEVAAKTWREWPIATVRPRGQWASGPVALLGDAAHAMSPYLAQGGAMAIEDAAVLASALGDRPDDPTGALARYEASRHRRVGRVWRAANSTADLYHMGVLTAPVRNLVMRAIGGRGLVSRYDWIYRWQPPKPAHRPGAVRGELEGTDARR